MAMTLNYLSAGTGSTPPTAALAYAVNTVNVTLSPAASTDNSQAITHNFNLPAADISSGWPEIVINGLDTLASASAWFVLSQNPNFSVIGRGANTLGLESGANAQVLVSISKPNTLVR